MFTYIPSITLLIISIFAIGIVYMLRLPLLIVALIAILLLAVSINQHFALFSLDYKTSQWSQNLAGVAPMIMVAAVIVLALSYIFMLRGFGGNSRTAASTAVASAASSNLPALDSVGPFAKRIGSNANRLMNRIMPNSNNSLLSALNRAV